MSNKVLFIGNKTSKDKRSIGGVSALNDNLLSFLIKKQIDITYYPLRKIWRSKFQLFDYFLFLIKFPFIVNKYDIISLHATRDFRITFAPFIFIISKIFDKKTVCHFYGGYFHNSFNKYPKLFRFWLSRTVLNANLVLFETQEQVKFFKEKLKSENIIWFPNARKKQTISASNKFSKKFVFISRVTQEKGIKLLIEAMKGFSDNYTLDIYGPIAEKSVFDQLFFDQKNVTYRGVLSPDKVIPTLMMYDVLVLPTLHVNEGYPGIIIESLSCGKPIITTKLVSLSEIIEDYKDGILIDRGDLSQLKNAIKFFDIDNYKKFSKNALLKFELFNQENVFSKLVQFYTKN